jgi:hypothetical protein
MSKSVFILFGPAFLEFGCDIALSLNEKVENLTVYGLCTGPANTYAKVNAQLSQIDKHIWSLKEQEELWEKKALTQEEIDIFSRDYPTDTFGKTLISDRKIGRAYVRGGICRPNVIGDKSVHDPNNYPLHYIINLYNFLDNALNNNRPDMVFLYAVAGAPAYALGRLCEKYDIKFRKLTPTRISDRYIMDTDLLGRAKPIADIYQKILQNPAHRDTKTWNEAKIILENMRSKPDKPEYQKHADNENSKTATKKYIDLSKKISRELYNLAIGKRKLTKDNIRNMIFEAQHVISKNKAENIISNKKLEKFPTIYFPLHVDPEASTMVMSPMFTDQLALIELISKSIPPNYTLVVKEHLSMYGLRPKGFYETIQSFPNTRLIGKEHSSFDCIKNADVTVTITGTAAWEAICMKKQTIILGDSPFLCIENGIHLERNPFKVHDTLTRCLQNPHHIPSDEALISYIYSALRLSFPLPASILWGNKYKKDNPASKISVAAISDHISSQVLNNEI